MLREPHLSIHKQVIREEVQLSRRRDLRVEHAHSSRRRISWICEYFPANPFLLPVQLFERFPRHHHFPANLEIRSQLRFFQRRSIHAQRHRPDRLHIRRHILARRTVSARHPAHQHAIFVLQRNAQPVELVLRNVLDFFLAAPLSHAPVPFAQRIIRKRVVQAQHRPTVPLGLKTLPWRAAHTHRRRIRCHQLRLCRFQLFQPLHHPVVCRVRDLRLIQHLIPVFVIAQLFAQFFNLFFHVLHVCRRRFRHTLSRPRSSLLVFLFSVFSVPPCPLCLEPPASSQSISPTFFSLHLFYILTFITSQSLGKHRINLTYII